MRRARLSAAEARRIALGAQGFGRPRPKGQPNVQHLRRVIHSLGMLQLDFVNVLVPAHYLVLWSRLGPYDRQRLDRLIWETSEFTEHWAHEACVVPMSTWPLLAYRRDEYRQWPQSPILHLPEREDYLRRVLQVVHERGPVVAADLPPVEQHKRRPGDWPRSVQRSALDHHFGHGRLAVAGRLPNFQRRFDLPERVIDASLREHKTSRDEAFRALLRQAALACGVGTVRDLADYWRMSTKDARPRILELAEEGTLIEVAVEGWREPGWLHADARIPRAIRGHALLSPFDPLVWFRPRTERLFDFHYRLEIYVPPAKRKWGYYVLPFLLDESIAARVDLKADRQAGELRVEAAWLEDGVDEARCAAALARELQQLAEWLQLPKVTIRSKRTFARTLSRFARSLAKN